MSTYTDRFGNDTVVSSTDSYRALSIDANFHAEWPLYNADNDSYLPNITDVTATTTSLTFYLPSASQVSKGTTVIIKNAGSNLFSVVDYDGNAVTTISAGITKYIYITDNSSNAGLWASFTLGAGSSSVDAASLAGL